MFWAAQSGTEHVLRGAEWHRAAQSTCWVAQSGAGSSNMAAPAAPWSFHFFVHFARSGMHMHTQAPSASHPPVIFFSPGAAPDQTNQTKPDPVLSSVSPGLAVRVVCHHPCALPARAPTAAARKRGQGAAPWPPVGRDSMLAAGYDAGSLVQ
eukprot:gene22116-biopygen11713